MKILKAQYNDLQAARYELFTSDKSQNNLRLYKKIGYQCFKEREITPALRFIYLEKATKQSGV